MAEDVTHHLPKVLLSIPVFPLELFHTLLNGLSALSPNGDDPSFINIPTQSVAQKQPSKFGSMLAGAWQQQKQERRVNKPYKKKLTLEDSKTRSPDLCNVGSPTKTPHPRLKALRMSVYARRIMAAAGANTAARNSKKMGPVSMVVAAT